VIAAALLAVGFVCVVGVADGALTFVLPTVLSSRCLPKTRTINNLISGDLPEIRAVSIPSDRGRCLSRWICAAARSRVRWCAGVIGAP